MTESENLENRLVTVESNSLISRTSGILRFKRWFEFTAGQVVNVTTSSDIPPRMYSIASSEHNAFIELLYKIVPEGTLTPKLEVLKKGDQLMVSEAFGKFVATDEPAWFIATGTGLAPFLSMLLSGYINDKTLLHGSRELTDFYFGNDLKELLGKRYVPCYSGNEDCHCFRGRVTAYLDQHKDLPVNIKYYLCGSAEMVVDTRQILIDKGIPFQNILSEIYF